MNPILGTRAAALAPHSLAAQAGLDVLKEGGNAIEASITMAACLAVVYPHMTGLGGDGFWLVHAPGEPMRALDASGAAGRQVHPGLYGDASSIPWRGPLACITVAGTVSGWGLAWEHSRQHWGGRLPMSRLLAPAADFARRGHPVTQSQQRTTEAKRGELLPQPGFATQFLMPGGSVPPYGHLQRLPVLADTLDQLGRAGWQDFYLGDLARSIAADLQHVGSPLVLADLSEHAARWVLPLELHWRDGTQFYNLPPPTQGLASLLILALWDRVRQPGWHPDTAEGVHALVECTKQAFRVRDRVVTDPSRLPEPPDAWLADEVLDRLAEQVDLSRASPWPAPVGDGDTTWLGAVDAEGRAVSMIQSIFFEYGSGVVLPGSGLCWQNRGCAFELAPGRLRSLAPGRKPFHTLNPAMAVCPDGRLIVYGTMGGEGQPQTQAAILTRLLHGGHDVRSAVAAPRWLLGRTWAEPSPSLKVEQGLGEALITRLRAWGHPVEVVLDHDERLGHAGMLVRHPEGWIEGGEDPRSDGAVAAW